MKSTNSAVTTSSLSNERKYSTTKICGDFRLMFLAYEAKARKLLNGCGFELLPLQTKANRNMKIATGLAN